MTNDLKTTLAGVVTGIATLVAHFVPAFEGVRTQLEPIIIAVGVAILAYFTNKPEKPA